jgi:hypothetical protein
MMPRARVEDDEGRRREWRSTVIPRHQRRTERLLGLLRSGQVKLRRLAGRYYLTTIVQDSVAA